MCATQSLYHSLLCPTQALLDLHQCATQAPCPSFVCGTLAVWHLPLCATRRRSVISICAPHTHYVFGFSAPCMCFKTLFCVQRKRSETMQVLGELPLRATRHAGALSFVCVLYARALRL